MRRNQSKGHTKWDGKGMRMLPHHKLIEINPASEFLLHVVRSSMFRSVFEKYVLLVCATQEAHTQATLYLSQK
jgi:hypothetical protein